MVQPHKLYYYLESKTFHCYSGCSCNYSVYDLIGTILGLEFSDSYKYLKCRENKNFNGTRISGSD